MGFALRTDLSRHRDQHDEELRPKYKCGWPDCYFETSRKDRLTKHIFKPHRGVGDQPMPQDVVHRVLEQSMLDYMPVTLSFMLAVREKRSKAAKVLLEHGADVMAKSATGKTALHFAAMNNDHDSTLILLCAGADSYVRDRYDCSALDVAAKSGHMALVRLILEALDPRMAACRPRDTCSNDSVPSNQVMLSQRREKVGADPENLALLKRTALQSASSKGHSAIVELLLNLGVDPNEGRSLYEASSNGHSAIVELLLNLGVDPNEGCSLYAASRNGHLAVVALLLKSGAHPNTPYPVSAIFGALERRHFEIVQLLLSSGADPNVRGFQGIDLLEVASATGQFEILKVLLDSGARIRVNGGSCGNAAQRASQRGHSKIVDLLLASTLSQRDRAALIESLNPEIIERLPRDFYIRLLLLVYSLRNFSDE